MKNSENQKNVSASNIAFTLTVTLLLIAPFIGQILGIGTAEENFSEKRNLASLPHLSDYKIEELPRAFDKYFNDNFPFRNTIINKTSLIRSLWLKQPSDHVIVGNGNWLFYKGDDIFQDLMGSTHFSENDIQNWLDAYKSKQDWLATKSIGYLLVSIPNKSTIHKGKLPWWIQTNLKTTRLEKLLTANTRTNDINWLDLTENIQTLKTDGKQTYWHNDTHWSGYSFQDSLYRIFTRVQSFLPDIIPDEIYQLTQIVVNRNPGDLSNLIGLNKDWPLEDRYQLQFSAPIDMKKGESSIVNLEKYRDIDPNIHTYPQITIRESGHGTVVIFHDSFLRVATPSSNFASNFPAALPFKRCIQIWARPTLEEIQEIVTIENPDLVIEERVERLLYEGNLK